MAPAKEKRKRKSTGRVKNDPAAVKVSDKNAVRKGHVVCITCVPSALCASERTVRDFFAEYGMLLSVTIHHNFLDMEPDGFMYLEYAEKEEAEAAVAAVKERSITGMKAALALPRGEPNFQVDEGMKDILLGRLEVNRFSQSQQEQAMDEDDLILQSLSQHSFTTSQPKRKKKRQKSSDVATTSDKPKKTKKKPRFSKVALPTE
ncbi:uncharacterized protein PITG_02089 [Phytophthora infestans T30-4]|uniref:RRM domain-containing protein n=1 Tax=Phytophthora infestans (strain T30-4) TaxID=403677 RepID=D0MVG1_PHYIT|nr:uncharacterized protein PITG_02089 [Phytophthora infestans T30-4]EEY63624.1 conserved hypothetical protein [Phytophthora infestans T30-4]|eukprot:XP_002907060.1 conserved hypothetical protein [Phytophthora infestans T30-4]